MTNQQHLAYLASDCWKCPPSPTGAHHWIERKVDNLPPGIFYCKYCFDAKEFPTSYQEAMNGKLSISRR